MAQVTATPADVTLSYGTFSTSGSATISWTTPTVPSGATITSVKLTGTVTATNTNTTAIKLNDQSLTVSTSGAAFTIDLGTDNSKTSLSASATKSNRFSSSSVKFTNMTYTVEYTEPTYTVIFKDENGSVLKTVTDVAKGERVKYIQPSMSKDGYSFIGWRSESDPTGYTVDNVYSDITLIPYFEKDPTITIKQTDGGYITYNNTTYEGDHSFNVKYRETFKFDIDVKDGYKVAYYVMQSEYGSPLKRITISNGFGLSIDATMSYTVDIKYVKADSKFNIKFEDYDGTLLKTETVSLGDDPSSLAPSNPTRAGYKFTGWSPSLSDPIVENTVFTAQYQECVTLTIKQNRGGYFLYNNVKYEGDQVFAFDSTIDADITIMPNDGYCTLYTIQKSTGYEDGMLDELGVTSSFDMGWQSIGDNSYLQIEYARLSMLNKENIIVNGKYVREAYLGNKPLKIYRGDDRIL